MKKSMYYDSNCADVFIYDSKRLNSKCMKNVHILHLICGHDNKISDDKILDYFISKIGEIVWCMKDCKEINFSCYTHYGKETSYMNANNDLYNHVSMFHIEHKRQSYCAIEDVINYMYRVIMDIYPYSKLDIYTIYANPSIKYIINNYYNHKKR